MKSTPLHRGAAVAAVVVWLGVIAAALVVRGGVEAVDFVAWLFCAYVLRYLVFRFSGKPGRLGAATVEASTHPVVRAAVDVTAIAYVLFVFWHLVASNARGAGAA